MDWLIDTGDTDMAPERVLTALKEHLRRHASDVATVDPGVEQAAGAVTDAVHAAAGRPLHLALDWRHAQPVLHLAAIEPIEVEVDAPADLVQQEPLAARHRVLVRSWPREQLGQVEIPVPRRSQLTFASGPPPVVADNLDPKAQGAAAVAVALASALEAHPTASAPQAAAIAGAMLANAAYGEDGPRDARAVAEQFAEIHHDLGSDAYVVAAEDDRVEVAVSQCPFANGPGGSSSICHVSSGLAGQLAAHVRGSATVLLDETMAAGDPECHLQVLLHDPEQPADGEGDTYFWPPRAAGSAQSVPHLDLSVALPRESVSVPVVRRLAAQALRAFGVHEQSVDDVQLAITEACANVIDHAAATDTYDVKIELAADRCAITVVDQGSGFDATQVPDQPANDAEEGRGLALMRALVDNVAFRNEPQAGAVVHMVKSLEFDPSHPLHRD